MIDPSEIVTNLVDALRDIEVLVKEMGDDENRIYAYLDSYPQQVSLVHAIHQMPVPGILVAWQGSAPGSFGGMDVWKHRITLFLRATGTSDSDQSTAYYTLFRLITKGVPASGDGTAMYNHTVHESCYPMDLPQIQRQTDAEGLDYFEVPITFTEIGDE